VDLAQLSAPFVDVYLGSSCKFLHSSVHPDSYLTYRVRASNAGGWSQWSRHGVAQTHDRVLFTRAFDFDTNGIVFWLGSAQRQSSKFINPATSATNVSVFSSAVRIGKAAALTSRTPQEFCTEAVRSASFDNVTAAAAAPAKKTKSVDLKQQQQQQQQSIMQTQKQRAYFIVDFGSSRRIAPTAYSLRNSSNGAYANRHWRLDASVDGVHWTVLKEHKNDTSLRLQAESTASWSLSTTIGSGSSKRTGASLDGDDDDVDVDGGRVTGVTFSPQRLQQKSNSSSSSSSSTALDAKQDSNNVLLSSPPLLSSAAVAVAAADAFRQTKPRHIEFSPSAYEPHERKVATATSAATQASSSNYTYIPFNRSTTPKRHGRPAAAALTPTTKKTLTDMQLARRFPSRETKHDYYPTPHHKHKTVQAALRFERSASDIASTSPSFRFFRVTLTGPAACAAGFGGYANCLHMSNFELYGWLREIAPTSSDAASQTGSSVSGVFTHTVHDSASSALALSSSLSSPGAGKM
jgi:hypothetical protein